ncbi:hemin uptake protein HemP [Ottowia sp. SB7-C50]|uniref:hemin uptake protein HemP n=1 Tax=Ottowia sp. SB7-C50 TaxID=3081231 RepID=UPI002953DD22|nr:hemin uptake protein HemP [Ottowia sp. SB7-C50]WOP14879.1 hemin uptake protein HemP [Ottowia sp. SB7-C50]
MRTDVRTHPMTTASPAAANGTPADAVPAPVPSNELMRGRQLLEISHNGAVYRLQQTRQGKLILTK